MESQVLWISFIVLIGIIGGFYFLFPRISRSGLLFGVYVGEEASKSEEARRITRSWYMGMAAWVLAGIVVAALSGLYFRSPAGSVSAVFLLSIGFLEEYLRAYFRARRMAGTGAPPAGAALIGVQESPLPSLPYWAVALGLVGGIAAIVYAWTQYDMLPQKVPTHFGFSGTPDAWRPKTFFTVMLLPMMSLVMGVGMGGMACLIGQAKRAIRARDQGVSFEAQQRFRSVMANFLAVIALMVTGMLTLLSYGSIRVGLGQSQALPPAMMILNPVLLVFAIGGSIYIAIKYGQGGSRLERSASNAPLTNGLADNRMWVLGMFYVDREDPSLFVERRFGLGYTINFGNPRAVALMFGFIGVIILIAIVAILTN
jgi:uncharacterized membrane protein